jgi:hypothetical protein
MNLIKPYPHAGPVLKKLAATQVQVGTTSTKYKLTAVPDKFDPTDVIHWVHAEGEAALRASLGFFERFFGYYPDALPYPSNPSTVIDYEPMLLPVRDQGTRDCCVSAAGEGFRELLWALKNGKVIDSYLSMADLDYNTRAREGLAHDNVGATTGGAAKVLQSIGICPDSAMPFSETDFATPPSPQARVMESMYRIGMPFRVLPYDRNGMIALLNAQRPIWTGFAVFESFENPGPGGVLTIPNILKEKFLGGHDILLVGVDLQKKLWKFRNSWGTSYGANGYGYMPFGYEDFFFSTWTADPV